MNYLIAFIVGGLICVVVQILMDNTKLLPGRIMVILVCTGAVLGAVGIYEPFAKWAGYPLSRNRATSTPKNVRCRPRRAAIFPKRK